MFAKQIFVRHGLFKTLRKISYLNDQFFNLKDCTRTFCTIRLLSSKAELKSHDWVQDFRSSFPELAKELSYEIDYKYEMREAIDRFEELMNYVVPAGKLNRGFLLIKSYEMFEKPENLTEENLNLVHKLAFAFEIMQAATLLIDDITDDGQMRRGLPCWHTIPEYKRTAVNDAFILENASYTALRKYLRHHPAYVQIMDLFHFFIYYCLFGQSLDIMCLDSNGKPMLDKFTMNRYLATVQHKCAYYCFQVPIVLGMYMANINDKELFSQVNNVTTKMGFLFQMQDDFLDCFGDRNLRRKIGDDIENGKCTWMVVRALERVSPSQMKILTDHYGRPDSESVAIVKNLYEELDLRSLYASCEQQSYNNISENIEQMSEGSPKELFHELLNKIIYKREL